MEEENKSEETKEDVLTKTKSEVERIIKQITENDLQVANVELLYKLIDIHKDIENENFWKEEINMYRGRDYFMDDSYNGGRSRDSRGRYMDGSYGRRGYDTKYRGHDMLDEMNYSYGAYSDNNEYGNYGEASTKELGKMLDCNIALIEHLKKNAKSQEEIEIIDRKLQEMSRL